MQFSSFFSHNTLKSILQLTIVVVYWLKLIGLQYVTLFRSFCDLYKDQETPYKSQKNSEDIARYHFFSYSDYISFIAVIDFFTSWGSLLTVQESKLWKNVVKNSSVACFVLRFVVHNAPTLITTCCDNLSWLTDIRLLVSMGMSCGIKDEGEAEK